MSKSCSGMLDEFIACVSESPCAQVRAARLLPAPSAHLRVQSKSLRECVKEDVPQCATKREARTLSSPQPLAPLTPLSQLYFICKRGQVDMRNRIRGNKGY